MPPCLRATLFLPVTSENDRTAYLRILNYLRSRHPGSGHTDEISGFTSTTDDPAPFLGFYWSSRLHEWVDDQIVMLFLDLPEERRGDVDVIKAFVEKMYRDEGAAQDEVWCTVERIEVL